MLRLDSRTIPGMGGNPSSGGGASGTASAAARVAAANSQRQAQKKENQLISGIDDSSSVKDVSIHGSHSSAFKMNDHSEQWLI